MIGMSIMNTQIYLNFLNKVKMKINYKHNINERIHNTEPFSPYNHIVINIFNSNKKIELIFNEDYQDHIIGLIFLSENFSVLYKYPNCILFTDEKFN